MFWPQQMFAYKYVVHFLDTKDGNVCGTVLYAFPLSLNVLLQLFSVNSLGSHYQLITENPTNNSSLQSSRLKC